jgi:hypothetical protein
VLTSSRGKLVERFEGGDAKLYSDVWDLTVRWARLDEAILGQVESVLIHAHVPPFNSQQVSENRRRSGPGDTCLDLVVMNAGRNGPLLPVMAGAYLASWTDSSGRSMAP